jgi:chromosome segregation ATPase
MSNSALHKLIRELVEEEIAEVSTSANSGFYNIPFAFRGNSAEGKAKAKKNATQAGYEPVNKTPEPADKDGDSEERVVSYGDKGKGGLKKPKDEPSPKIEENKALEDRLKQKEDKIKQAEKALRKYKDSPSKKADVEDNIKKLKANIATIKRELSKKNEHMEFQTEDWDSRDHDKSTDKKKDVDDRIRFWQNEKSTAKTEKQKQKADEKLKFWQNEKSAMNENRYTALKTAEGTPTRKIAEAVREINRQISEIDRVLTLNSRLKRESGLEGGNLYKNTVKSITRLESKLQHLSAKLRELKA